MALLVKNRSARKQHRTEGNPPEKTVRHDGRHFPQEPSHGPVAPDKDAAEDHVERNGTSRESAHVADPIIRTLTVGETIVISGGVRLTLVAISDGTVRLKIAAPTAETQRRREADEFHQGVDPAELVMKRCLAVPQVPPLTIHLNGPRPAVRRTSGHVIFGIPASGPRRLFSEPRRITRTAGTDNSPQDEDWPVQYSPSVDVACREKDQKLESLMCLSGQIWATLVVLTEERATADSRTNHDGYLSPPAIADRVNGMIGSNVPDSRVKCLVYELRRKLLALYQHLFGVDATKAREAVHRIIHTDPKRGYRLTISPDNIRLDLSER